MELLPDGTRFDRGWNDFVLMGGASLLIWVVTYPAWVFPTILTCLLLGAAWWRSLRPLRRIVLTDEAVTETMGSVELARVPLDQIRSIKSEFIPNGDPLVNLVSHSGTRITFSLRDDAKDFLQVLGEQLNPQRSRIHANKTMVKVLGWPEVPTQWD